MGITASAKEERMIERLSENEKAELQETAGMESEGDSTESELIQLVDADHALPQRFVRLAEKAREHVENSKAANTRRAYKSDWQDFTGWCRYHGVTDLPASSETVALYLTDCAEGLKTSTLQRRLSTISQAHQAAGHESPTRHPAVRAVWQGIKREKGMAMQGKSPTLTADIRCMIEHLPPDKLLSVRDRCLLLIGFAGAMRRSELVGLDMSDVQDTGEGLVVTIRRSKTDQEGAGRKIGIPYGSTPPTCPVRAFREWKVKSGIEAGALFRGINRHGKMRDSRLTDQMVARIVKRALLAAGREAEAFAGHSLRAGLATQAALNGVNERSIQEQTGHKSLPILRRYIRDGSLFRENAASKIGL
jgi:site-specific recombinase XerD